MNKENTVKGMSNLQRFSFSRESVLWSGEDAHLKYVVLDTENMLTNMLSLTFLSYNSHHTVESSVELSRSDIRN